MSFLSGIFGGNQVQAPTVTAPTVNVNPTGFVGGGLFGGFNPSTNNYSVSANPNRTSLVSGVQSTFNQQASDIAGLRQQWAPGASALRSSLMTALQNNRTQSLGNLRDNLAQRRVLGSSFAQNSLANADQTYQQQIQQIQAQTFLTELSAQQQLSQQQYAAARGAFQSGIDEMNLETGIATDLTSKATSALTSAATTQAQLDLQAQTANANNSMQAQIANQKSNNDMASGFGSFLGKAFGGPLGSLGSSIFGSLGSALGGVGAGIGSDAAAIGEAAMLV